MKWVRRTFPCFCWLEQRKVAEEKMRREWRKRAMPEMRMWWSVIRIDNGSEWSDGICRSVKSMRRWHVCGMCEWAVQSRSVILFRLGVRVNSCGSVEWVRPCVWGVWAVQNVWCKVYHLHDSMCFPSMWFMLPHACWISHLLQFLDSRI